MDQNTLWEGYNARTWQKRLGVPAVHVYATTGSTNDIARELAEADAPNLTLVVADHQTKGRGRAGRDWLSVPGSSLLCSIVFRSPANGAVAHGAAPVRVGMAVAEAVSSVADVDARLKWPNDVVIPGAGKVAGILCEAVIRQQGTAFVVAGIGVNVHSPGADYVAINRAGKTAVSRAQVLQAIIRVLKPLVDDITAPLNSIDLAAIRQRDILYGKEVEDDGGLVGRACGISADGSLLVLTADGVRAVHNATIRLAGTHDYPGARV